MTSKNWISLFIFYEISLSKNKFYKKKFFGVSKKPIFLVLWKGKWYAKPRKKRVYCNYPKTNVFSSVWSSTFPLKKIAHSGFVVTLILAGWEKKELHPRGTESVSMRADKVYKQMFQTKRLILKNFLYTRLQFWAVISRNLVVCFQSKFYLLFQKNVLVQNKGMKNEWWEQHFILTYLHVWNLDNEFFKENFWCNKIQKLQVTYW